MKTGISRRGWIAVAVAMTVFALLFTAAAAVFAVSESILNRRHAVPLETFPPSTIAAAPGEGRRMAILVGCLEGCHGREGEGGSEGADGIFNATAPTLSSVLPSYSDAELVRLVRFGVKRDGTAALGMPSPTFFPLGDEDLRAIITHLRERPAMPDIPRSRDVTLLGRLALVLGKWHTSADAVDPSLPRWGQLPRETPFERGRYLASVICTECHGPQLQGDEFMGSPPLGVVRAYNAEQFAHLMRTGQPVSGRDLGIMSIVARNAFSHFTPGEVTDIHTYLTTMQPPPARRRDAAY